MNSGNNVGGYVFFFFFVIFIFATILRAILESVGVDENKFLSFLQRITFQPSQLKALAPYQVAAVSAWYAGCLGVAVYLPYALLVKPETLPLLNLETGKLLNSLSSNETAKFLIQCFACGVIGATLYGILWISRIYDTNNEWYFRRYLLLPLLGGFLGACSYLFVKAGLITVQHSSSTESAAGATSVSAFAVWGIAFLSGFASRELTAKLIQISEAVFAKAPETSPVTPAKTPETSSVTSTKTPETPPVTPAKTPEPSSVTSTRAPETSPVTPATTIETSQETLAKKDPELTQGEQEKDSSDSTEIK